MNSDSGRRGKSGDHGPRRGRFRAVVRVAEVRLRLPLILIATALVLGRWDGLRNHFDRWISPTPSESIAGHAISTDTEYFCPMDPGILSEWPGRCGVCNMVLVRRRKGEAVLLPEGVVARMQLSPYRVQLAGIQTTPAWFRALAREWTTSGLVTCRGTTFVVAVDLPPSQSGWIDRTTAIEVTAPAGSESRPLAGRLVSATQGDRPDAAMVAIEGPPGSLREGVIVRVRFRRDLATLEPYRSQPRDPPRLAPGEPRRLYACAEHSDSTATTSGPCPLDGKERVPRDMADFERIRWWCPMHPDVRSDRPGARCAACGGMELRPRTIALAPAGQVLAVPQSAVVDTGAQQVVFVEGMPGMLDGVAVVLGDRCGDFYPVLSGLEPGQRVAAAGAFLLDAETRLNPSLAAGYFGAARGRSDDLAQAAAPASPLKTTSLPSGREGLSPPDRQLAERQQTCPVTGLALGSMGTPDRQTVAGRVVFLCCSGCRARLAAEPAKYLARLPASTSDSPKP